MLTGRIGREADVEVDDHAAQRGADDQWESQTRVPCVSGTLCLNSLGGQKRKDQGPHKADTVCRLLIQDRLERGYDEHLPERGTH